MNTKDENEKVRRRNEFDALQKRMSRQSVKNSLEAGNEQRKAYNRKNSIRWLIIILGLILSAVLLSGCSTPLFKQSSPEKIATAKQAQIERAETDKEYYAKNPVEPISNTTLFWLILLTAPVYR